MVVPFPRSEPCSLGRRGAVEQYPLLVGLVRLNPAVAQTDDALGVLGHFVFVRDQDDGLALVAEFFKDQQDFLGGFGVEVARRFVGQNEVRVVHQAARDRDVAVADRRTIAWGDG